MTLTVAESHAVEAQVRKRLAASTLPLIVNGRARRWRRELLPVTDPSTGRRLTSTASANAGEINEAVAAARTAFECGPWASLAPAGRQRLLNELRRCTGSQPRRVVHSGVPKLREAIWGGQELRTHSGNRDTAVPRGVGHQAQRRDAGHHFPSRRMARIHASPAAWRGLVDRAVERAFHRSRR
ncbi:aldehyde dehydrogenase family protein [Arthrobacter sp. SDTb3-6]|uniref:aldehyde dehydrogenase family protein n=1 Tax=Arthrobacter sp. SDTb3-6 TaxID=2713571 RepID=UPI00159E1599|nr:aldehyde dehydrogenase family protein [Arthrobacter sp. SDTb3-6]